MNVISNVDNFAIADAGNNNNIYYYGRLASEIAKVLFSLK